MFCPKCGADNPETGKFCRSCGTDLGNVSAALSGKLPQSVNLTDLKGRPVTWGAAVSQFSMGIGFLIVAVALGATGKGGGWWFWMLIPAFAMLGSGAAKYVQLKKSEESFARTSSPASITTAQSSSALPPAHTEFVAPESRYKTGDLVPPSVAEGTTRQLEIDKEGQTMTLPKI